MRKNAGNCVSSLHWVALVRTRNSPILFVLLWFCAAATGRLSFGAAPAAADYTAVHGIFDKHCLDCHASQDPEHGLILESFEGLMKGGETGPSIVPGKSQESLLVQMIEGRLEKGGKSKVMPPGKRKKLTPDEIATIKVWIDSGAKGPANPIITKDLMVPKISPKSTPRQPILALACSRSSKIIAAAQYGQVELRDATDLHLIRTLSGSKGNVNAVVFSSNASQLFAAAGHPALAGEVRQWNVADGKLIQVFEGHKDSIYALALSPDGATLATGSYDQKIKLWDVATGKETRTLSGHNGCVYQLAFRPDGKILASASADRTVKLWDVASSERRETFSQALKEVRTVAFSVDGKRLYAGGGDSRIRVWEISANAAETTNPILHSKFAHEGAILSLAFSADGKTLCSAAEDRTVKLWDPQQMKAVMTLEQQPDWPPALALGETGKVFVGRLDGSITGYDIATGKAIVSIAPEAALASAKAISQAPADATSSQQKVAK
jgi:WD40 repeat protein